MNLLKCYNKTRIRLALEPVIGFIGYYNLYRNNLHLLKDKEHKENNIIVYNVACLAIVNKMETKYYLSLISKD